MPLGAVSVADFPFWPTMDPRQMASRSSGRSPGFKVLRSQRASKNGAKRLKRLKVQGKILKEKLDPLLWRLKLPFGAPFNSPRNQQRFIPEQPSPRIYPPAVALKVRQRMEIICDWELPTKDKGERHLSFKQVGKTFSFVKKYTFLLLFWWSFFVFLFKLKILLANVLFYVFKKNRSSKRKLDLWEVLDVLELTAFPCQGADGFQGPRGIPTCRCFDPEA